MRRPLLIALLIACSCASEVRRFPLTPPLWEDPDRHPVSQRPESNFSGLVADGADQLFFRPLAEVWTFPRAGEAMNVNTLDEVPNSSWFTNRIGAFDLSPAQAARAACGERPALSTDSGPWTVTAAKPNGATPGFFIKAGDGASYLLKFDGASQLSRATAADVIGSKIFWAAGYNAPCNTIVYFDREHLEISPDATSENSLGEDVPITREDIDKILSAAMKRSDGLLRASASRFVDGQPIGPFRYEGTRGDDPNDIIPHEDRRELRASRIFAAWINRYDSREQNTLDVWVENAGGSYLEHYIIDFGDGFGGTLSGAPNPLNRRLGLSYYLDWADMGVDLLTLGFIPRPWNEIPLSPYDVFGYYEAEHFEPSAWKAGYPNPAFQRMTGRDAAWAVRILARFTDAHIRAMVATGQLTDPRHDEYLIDTLVKRRDKIIREYATKYSPLSNFAVVRRTTDTRAQSVCFEDESLRYGAVIANDTLYKVRIRGGTDLDQVLGRHQFTPSGDHPHQSCVPLSIARKRPAQLADGDAPDDDPARYAVMDIFVHQNRSKPHSSVTELHFYDLGDARGFRLVGVDRPPDAAQVDLN